jgi:hypothetical protein
MQNKSFVVIVLLLLSILAVQAQQLGAPCHLADDFIKLLGDTTIVHQDFAVIQDIDAIHQFYSFKENYEAVLDTLHIGIYADTISNTFKVALNQVTYTYHDENNYHGIWYIDGVTAHKVSIGNRGIYFLTFFFAGTTGYEMNFVQYMVFNPNKRTYQLLESRYGTPLYFNDFDGDGVFDFLALQDTPNNIWGLDYIEAAIMPIKVYSMDSDGDFLTKQSYLSACYIIQTNKKAEKGYHSCYHMVESLSFWETYKRILSLSQGNIDEYFLKELSIFIEQLE